MVRLVLAERNRVTVPELLAPLRATANRLAMDRQPPFLVYEANVLDDAGLAGVGQHYRDTLSRLPAVAARRKAA